MKKHYASLLLILIIFQEVLYAQKQERVSWLQLMQDHKASLYDVQKAFYADPENPFSGKANLAGEDEEESGGWEQFKRYEYYASPRVYPSGDRSLLARKAAEYENYQKARMSQHAATPVLQSAGWS